jgi:endoglucanase
LSLAACARPTATTQAAAPSVAASSPKSLPPSAPGVTHVQGDHLLGPDGQPLVLRGVAFGNQVWLGRRLPVLHHNEQDYARIAELGMNAVRFYINYHTLEEDSAPGVWLADGLKWLDDNVLWAKRHGIYLILNMHIPPGGFQSLGEGKALWSDAQNQARFIAIWRALAARYVHEPAVAGFDLLNEPVVETGIAQWQTLAERTISAIREVDPGHAIFVERVNAVGSDWGETRDRNFFRVKDPNVVYEFHFYKPFHFTHQGAAWVDFAAPTGRYPDPKVAEVEWFLRKFETGTFDSPRLPAGDSPWRQYQSTPFTVTDAKLTFGKPTLNCSRVGAGHAYFDDLIAERLDAAGKPIEELWHLNLVTPRGWYFWEKSGKGSRAIAATGHGDSTSLSVTGTTDEANLGADYLAFRPVLGATYRLSGWMKGVQIPKEANCQLRLDFSSASVPVQGRDRAFLEQELNAYLAWGRREHVPLYLGEFGAIRATFDDDRGGARWTEDMLDLAAQNRLSFTYHDYHEQSFGLFFGDDTLPDPKNSNQALLDLFKRKLAHASP